MDQKRKNPFKNGKFSKKNEILKKIKILKKKSNNQKMKKISKKNEILKKIKILKKNQTIKNRKMKKFWNK